MHLYICAAAFFLLTYCIPHFPLSNVIIVLIRNVSAYYMTYPSTTERRDKLKVKE